MFGEHFEHKIAEGVEAVKALTLAVNDLVEWHKSHSQLATKHDLFEMEKRIMSQITDFAAQEQIKLDAISATLDGIVTGIAALDALITQLQNSPGTLSKADQAALDAIQASSQALVAKSGAISVTPPTAESMVISAIPDVAISLAAAPGLATVALGGIISTAVAPQTISVGAVSSDNGAVISAPAVVYTSPASSGSLTFTPIAVGTATVTVTVSDGIGSAVQTFVVTVTA